MSALAMKSSPRQLGRKALAAGLLSSIMLLAGCGTRDGMHTGSVPDDYRQRHPIVLTEVEHTLDFPVSSADTRMTVGMRDAIGGFASEYHSRATSIVQIMLPQGSPNAGAARYMAKEIRQTLTKGGVPASKIVMTSYQAESQGDAAPIRLSYVAMTAATSQCGQWPEDLATAHPIENRNWQNFGCATQANLAAQIANPMDLVTPRQQSPIDAARRTTVINTYRAGEGTSTTTN